MPVKFGIHFLPRMKTVPNGAKLHLNDIGSANNEFCERQIRMRQPPISWTFCNAGVRVNVTHRL